MDKEITSLIELVKFESKNSDRVKRRANGDRIVKAKIIFDYASESVVEYLEIIINKSTMEGGRINFMEGEQINTETLHTEFYPKFQSYKCSSEGYLIITGKSPKIGNYKITIITV